jgi:hypothetical protein
MSEKYFEKDAFFDVFLHISGFGIFEYSMRCNSKKPNEAEN